MTGSTTGSTTGFDDPTPDPVAATGGPSGARGRGRRASAMALLAAGGLTGVVLGLSGTAFGADDPATTDGSTGSSTAVVKEDCPEGGRGPGGRGPGSDGTAPAPAPGTGDTTESTTPSPASTAV